MTYCITLLSHDDPDALGYYDGTANRWTTDPKRRKFFKSAEEAAAVVHELRQCCPHNAEFITVRDDFLEQWVAHEEAKWLATERRKAPWWTDVIKVTALSLLLAGALWAVTYILARSIP